MAFQLDEQGWGDEGEVEPPAAAVAAAGIPMDLSAAMKSGGVAAAAGMGNIPRGKTPAQQMHDPNLPFQIGDRVILQNLVGSAALNGRHGCIASNYDKKTQRYPIDLDLPNRDPKAGGGKPLSVKEANLKKEPLVEISDDMPAIINGCLEPAHAKVASFIFHVMRVSCSQTLKGETNSLKLAAFGWQYWKQTDETTKAEGGVYPSLKAYLTKGILEKQKLTDLDKQVSEDPKNPKPGAYKLVTKAMTSTDAVAAWNVRIEGEFYIVGMGPQGTMVVPCHNPRQVYVVVGFQAPLIAVAGGNQKFPRPPKFHLTLLPWFGVLIHDTFLCTTTGTNQVELSSPQLAPQLIELTKRAVAEGRVITSLNQLRAVNPPNLQGVPFVPPAALVKQVQMAQQPPMTDGEKAVADKISKITNIIGPPNGLWNFIRPPTMDNSSKSSFIILNAKGEQMDTFKPRDDLKPDELPQSVLEQVVLLTEKNSTDKQERPAAIGVDDATMCQRLQFICQNIPNLRILMLNVKPGNPNGGGTTTNNKNKPEDEDKKASSE